MQGEEGIKIYRITQFNCDWREKKCIPVHRYFCINPGDDKTVTEVLPKPIVKTTQPLPPSLMPELPVGVYPDDDFIRLYQDIANEFESSSTSSSSSSSPPSSSSEEDKK
jgi:hypothetical protein